MKPETIYHRLLENLAVNGCTYERIMHPLFYTYPYALRFEIGDPELAQMSDWERYARSAIVRAGVVYHTVFDPEDQVLVIIDKTPDRELKAALSGCLLQRIRSKILSPFPDYIDDE